MTKKCFLSIVIVNWNGADHVRRCLGAIQEDLSNGAGADVQVVVVDNGSRDDSISQVRRTMPSAKVVELSANEGFAAAANRGIAVAEGEWVALLNNDARVEVGWVNSMRRVAIDSPSCCGMLQSCVVRDDDSSRIDTTGVVVAHGGGIEDRHRNENLEEAKAARAIFCVSASAAWYRRRMLDEVAPDRRPFDPGYFMYYEDVDLGWRCRLSGWTAEYVQGAVVRHVGQGSAQLQTPDFVKRQCVQNRLRVILANASCRFVVGSVPRLFRDISWLVGDSGRGALLQIGRAVRDGLSARRRLPRRSRLARRQIEVDWFISR
jgi:GT2 family glycosyltransferase